MRRLSLYLEFVRKRHLDLWLFLLFGVIFVSIQHGWSFLDIVDKIRAYISLMQVVAFYFLLIIYAAVFSLGPVVISLYMGYTGYKAVKKLGKGNPLVAGVKTAVLVFLVLHLFFFFVYHTFDAMLGGKYSNIITSIIEFFITQQTK